MSAREYPLNLTYAEIAAVAGALDGYEAEYGLSGMFYAPRTLQNATVEEHRAEARRASDEANLKAERLLNKAALLRTLAAELEPVTNLLVQGAPIRFPYGDCIIEDGPGNDFGNGLGEIDGVGNGDGE